MATPPQVPSAPSTSSNPLRILRIPSKLITKLRTNPETAKQLADDGLTIMLNSAKMLKSVCGATPFPYISHAAGGLVTIIECIQLVQKNKDDYIDLVDRIRVLLELLNEESMVRPQLINARFETVCREFYISLEATLNRIQGKQHRDRKYLTQLLKSTSIRNDIDRLRTQLEDARMNLLTTMAIDTSRNTALGFARISDENRHVLSTVSNLNTSARTDNTTEMDDYASELQTVRLRDWVSTGPPRLTEPKPWISEYSDAIVYEQSAKILIGNVNCIVRTFRGQNESQKQIAYELWKKEMDFLVQCRASFLPQLFGISRSEHGPSLFLHAGDEPDIPVSTYFRRLDPLMRILFRSKYSEALAGAQSFMRATMQRSLGTVDSPSVDRINIVGSGGHIKIMNWSRGAKEAFYAGQPCPLFEHTANLDLEVWPSAVRSFDLRSFLIAIITKETFGASAHYTKIYDKKFLFGLGHIHCTCCNWNLPVSSLRASRSASPALLLSWIGAAPDHISVAHTFGLEADQQKHDVFANQDHGTKLRVFNYTLQLGRQVIACEVRCRSDRQIHHSYLAIPCKNHADYFFLNSYFWEIKLDYTPNIAKITLPIDSTQFFVSVTLKLSSGYVPLVHVAIFCDVDCHYPLNSSQLANYGIDLTISNPTVGLSHPHVYLGEVEALCNHVGVSITTDVLPWLDQEFGVPKIYPG